MASNTTTEVTIDAKFLTRTLGTYIMYAAVAMGLFNWINVFAIHLPNFGWLQLAMIWTGIAGSILFFSYFLLRLFGYAK